jgi:hypothetical protein
MVSLHACSRFLSGLRKEIDMDDASTRRRVLAGVSVATVANVAGCLTDGDGSGDGGTVNGPTTSTDDLDLREANVTDVALESQSGGDVRFSVTLIHDDDGEDGYANWWAAETLDGEELGRRELSHAHGTREFTRSETVSVPGGVECVVVRGHDQTHEYGGQAAVVSMASGATRFATQGSDRSSFANADCP